MRVQVAQEGEKIKEFDHRLTDGCLKWVEGKEYPVLKSAKFDDPSNILGHATDIRREDNGVITAEIDFELMNGLGVTIFANKVERTGSWEENNVVVTSATIRAFFTTVEVPWSGSYVPKEHK